MIYRSSSHARLENKLNLLINEVRAGKREGSVISTQTFDTAAQNDQETWEALRKELEDIGISPGIITEKRQFIIAWFQEAVAAGKLEEDALSDDRDSAISLYESDRLANKSDDDKIPEQRIPSMMTEPRTTERTTISESVLKAQNPSEQPAEVLYSQPPQKDGKSRSRVTHFLNKLLGRDKQFLETAMAGDVSTTKKLLEQGVDIQARGLQGHETETALNLAASKGADFYADNTFGETALHRAALNGNEQSVRLLLKKEVDVDSTNRFGHRALINAAGGGHVEVVRLLRNRGADIESATRNGNTALFNAAGERHVTVVRLLLEKEVISNLRMVTVIRPEVGTWKWCGYC